jgi:hypothetical protein
VSLGALTTVPDPSSPPEQRRQIDGVMRGNRLVTSGWRVQTVLRQRILSGFRAVSPTSHRSVDPFAVCVWDLAAVK